MSTEYEDCVHGDIRLEGGVNDYNNYTRDGRIQICLNNAWGTVCNTSFGLTDAHVACSQLIGFQPEGDMICFTTSLQCQLFLHPRHSFVDIIIQEHSIILQ